MNRQSLKSKQIAVVGMACRLPGANNLREFWELISQGKSAIAPVPENRFNRKLYFVPKKGVVGRSYCDKAALIDYSDVTRPGGWITEQDIKNHDPVHISLFRVAEEAFRYAGIDAASMKNRNIGVFLGHAASSGLGGDLAYGLHIAQVAQYLYETPAVQALPEASREAIVMGLIEHVRAKMPRRTAEYNPRLTPGDAAQFVGQKFGFTGPAMVFNSACASALQAVAHGMKSLQLGRIDAALVGGAAYFHQDTLILFSAAQSLSAIGSFPFTEQADGLIPGEGCVIFLLKTLERALADGDEIHAVLPGVGISSDGKGASLWAPRKEGQIEAMLRGYESGTDMAGLEYIEGHITSTHLGDKTEINSITELFRDRPLTKRRIPIGSVKRNIGHALEVAGAAGLLKVILSLKHETIPSSVEPGLELNKDIDWENVPVFPPDRNLPWPVHTDGTPRRAGVNAFGIGGLNVHLVVEDYRPSPAVPVAGAFRDDTKKSRAIAIIGMGTVLPDALDEAAFRSVLTAGKRTIRPLPVRPWNVELFSDRQRWDDWAVEMPGAGVVEDFQFDWKRHKIPPKQVACASPLQFMILDAVDQAFRQAGMDVEKQIDHSRTGCVIGTMFGGDFATQLVMGLRLPETCDDIQAVFNNEEVSEELTRCVLKHLPALVDETGSFTSSALASRVTKACHLLGGGVSIDAGNNSGMAALLSSIDMLLTNACDLMVCVAGQHDLTPGMFQQESLSKRLAERVDFPAPFDRNANGTLPGEGCVALLLKRLENAQRDGDRILGIIEGIGTAVGHETSEAVSQAARRALADAEVDSALIGYVEAVGGGVSAVDCAELDALGSIYGTSPKGYSSFVVGSPVGIFGHLGAAAGFVSLVTGLVALEQQTFPGTVALTSSARSSQKIILSNQPQPMQTGDSLGRLFVAIDACSDYESCFHVILKRGTPVTPAPSTFVSRSYVHEFEQVSKSVIHFDATVMRRNRLRSGSLHPTEKTPTVVPLPGAIQPNPTEPVVAISKPVTIRVAPPKPIAIGNTVPVSPPTVSDSTSVPSLDAEEVKAFLINYVIEQTGYPREMVDLDAQLDTDLGIDSIKKGQLLGELAECFDIQPRGDVTFEEITTLRKILDILTDSSSSVQEYEPASVETPVVAESVVSQAVPTASALDPVELEAFLVNYVIEQTGYPREMVDLDAQLDTDLGIDSIKKGQLLGELAECFDVQPRGDITFEEITTLRTILNVLLEG